MVQEMKTAFAVDQDAAEGLLAFARMALGEITDAANSLRKILAPMIKACSAQEKHMAVRMMEKIAQIEGPINDQQAQLIAQTKHALTPVK